MSLRDRGFFCDDQGFAHGWFSNDAARTLPGALQSVLTRVHAHAHVCTIKLTEFCHAPHPHRPCPWSPHPDPAGRSGVHGKGVFAVQDIAEGEVLIEYTGEVITWQEAQDRHPHDPASPTTRSASMWDEDRVIDANYGGNARALDQPQLRPQLARPTSAGTAALHHRECATSRPAKS